MTDPVAAYQEMSTATRKQVLLAEYRCRVKGCLLLHIWQTPGGRFWYLPPYDLSPRLSQETAESARDKRTSDGHRKWRARAGSLDQLLEFFANESEIDGVDVITSYSVDGGLTVNCDHNVRQTITAAELATVIAGATPGAPSKVFLP